MSEEYPHESEMNRLKGAVRGAFEGAIRRTSRRSSTLPRYKGLGFKQGDRTMGVSYLGKPSDIPQHIFRVADRFDRCIEFHECGYRGRGLETRVKLTPEPSDRGVVAHSKDDLEEVDEMIVADRYLD